MLEKVHEDGAEKVVEYEDAVFGALKLVAKDFLLKNKAYTDLQYAQVLIDVEQLI